MSNTINKPEHLLEALGDIPDEMLLKAAPDTAKISKRRRIPPVFAAAAAAVLVVGGITAGVVLSRNTPAPPIASPTDSAGNTPDAPSESADLPKINAAIDFGAMGFEGLMYPGECEYISGNGWSEEQNITSLPVFRNGVVSDFSGEVSVPFSEIRDELSRQLLSIASALGADISVEDITDNSPTEKELEKILETCGTAEAADINMQPTQIQAHTDSFRIITDNRYHTMVWFNDGMEPEQTFYSATYEDTLETAEMLKSEYSGLLAAAGITDPVVRVVSGDYTFSGERIAFSISFYNAGQTSGESIVNSELHYVNFYGSNGRLNGIHIQRRDLISEPVGDYPLLSVAEAAEQLRAGNYITSVPVGEDYLPEDYGVVALEYRTDSYSEFFIPYYRFFVDVTDKLEMNTKMHTYGVFYVPAIRPEYLDVQTWDGRFN